MTEREKYVDESWKDTVAQEKEKFSPPPTDSAKKEPAGAHAQPNTQQGKTKMSETDIAFLNYLASLGYQAMIFLGEMVHPVTNEYEKNPEQAKMLIDTLIMLREKTKGNLSKQEEDMLNTSIYELELKYVEVTQGKPVNDR